MSTPPTQWNVFLPYNTPPLTANQRMHHRQRAQVVKNVRASARVVAQSLRIPGLPACQVELHYVPRDSRRRDADNLVPTLKAACDGLVDARIVPDDTPEWMDKRMPIIHRADPTRRNNERLWLFIIRLEARKGDVA